MDFSPRPAGFNAPIARASFDDTAAKLLARSREVVSMLLPAGRLNGVEWEVGGTDGAKGKSLKINTKTGVWSDFESGQGGHDLIALWAEVTGVKMIEAKKDAEKWLGEEYRPPVSHVVTVPSWSKAVPGDAPKTMKQTAKWDYCDEDGVYFGSVYRYEDPDGKRGKEYRPWNGKEYKAPEGLRPLYNLPALLRAPSDALIVLVEGEKCADAINALNDPLLIGCSSWGGAAAASKTDWSPLNGCHVLRWPDGDHPNGNKPTGRDTWLKGTLEHVTAAGPASLRDLNVPEGKPDGWDCADAGPEERRALIEAAVSTRSEDVSKPVLVIKETVPRVRLADNTAAFLFTGRKPPVQVWLVDSVIPFGRGGVFAAPGDTGKGMLMVDLAVKVATPEPAGLDTNPPQAFGHTVARRGAVVILSAEDDTDELHRRVLALHPDIEPAAAVRLHILPYPDLTERSPTYMVGDANKVDPTQEFRDVYAELKGLRDLALVIIDPLSAFAGVDMTASNPSQQVGNAIDKLAKDLGCTVIACHHLTKGDRRYPIETAADARHAIGGSGQLLNAMRFAYAMWAPGETKEREVLTALGRPFVNNSVFRGAIVKANAASDRDIGTFARNEKTGLLELVPWKKLREDALKVADVPSWLVDIVRHSVGHFANLQRPVLKTWICETQSAADKKKGTPTGQWFHLMPRSWTEYVASEWGGMSRPKIMDAIIDAGLVCQMEGKQKYLYLPGDKWDLGAEGGGWHFPRDMMGGIKPPAPVPPMLSVVE